MVKHKEIIKLLIFMFISIIGFSSGMNFFDSVDPYTVQTAKGCFEFGMYEVLGNEEELIIFGKILLSAIKYLVIMIFGIFSWWTFLIVPINNFSLGFKLGVSASLVFKILGFKGFFECLLLAILIIGILGFTAYVSYTILNKRLYHSNNRRIDMTDKSFICKTFSCVVVFVIIIFLFYIFLKIIQSRLYGLTETFL